MNAVGYDRTHKLPSTRECHIQKAIIVTHNEKTMEDKKNLMLIAVFRTTY
jgi:hypothetical protein